MFSEELEHAPMMNTGKKGTNEAQEISLPTVEELWEAIEAAFTETPEIQRPTPIGLTSTSRKLARNWQAILDESTASQVSSDHYLSECRVVSEPSEAYSLESDFVIALITFVVGRLGESLQEMRQAQLQLQEELARYSPR